MSEVKTMISNEKIKINEQAVQLLQYYIKCITKLARTSEENVDIPFIFYHQMIPKFNFPFLL